MARKRPNMSDALGINSGTGVRALFADTTQLGSPLKGARMLPVGSIIPNSRQPRQVFDQIELNNLASTIREHGVVQPIVVRPHGEQDGQKIYELVAGERRLRATKIAGEAEIPAIIRDLSDEEAVYWTAIENGQRADLDPEDRARELAYIQEVTGDSDRKIAERLGCGRNYVNNHLRVLRRMPELFAPMRTGELNFKQVLALLPYLETHPDMLESARRGETSWIELLETRAADRAFAEQATDGTDAEESAEVSYGKTLERAELEPKVSYRKTGKAQKEPSSDDYTPWRRRPLESFSTWFRRVDIRMVPRAERRAVREDFAKLRAEIERAEHMLAELEEDDKASIVINK